jgi:hypothetical protein
MEAQPTDTTPEQVAQTPRSANRSARSKEGCLTCKRRKVKCDEQRPRCSHCERLNLECKWQGLHARRQSTATTSSDRNAVVRTPMSMSSGPGIPSGHSFVAPQNAVNQIFDYASFMWEGGDVWQQANPETGFDGLVCIDSHHLRKMGHPDH